MSSEDSTAPCVLCGYPEAVVKLEVSNNLETEEESDQPGVQDGDHFQREFSSDQSFSSLNPDLPQRSSLVPSRASVGWTEDEKCAYQWFLKWFKLENVLTLKSHKGKRFRHIGWNDDSGKDPFPFCGSCGGQLLGLTNLQRQVELLEIEIKSGIEDLKIKANSSEDVFGRSKIYQRDDRYVRVRKQIIPDFLERNPSQRRCPPASKSNSESRRLSSRIKAVSSECDPPLERFDFDLTINQLSASGTANGPDLNEDIKPVMTEVPSSTFEELQNEDNHHDNDTSRRSRRKRKLRFSSKLLETGTEEPLDLPFPDDDVPSAEIEENSDFDPLSPPPPPAKKKKTKTPNKSMEAQNTDSSSQMSTSSGTRKKVVKVVADEDWADEDDDDFEDYLGSDPSSDDDDYDDELNEAPKVIRDQEKRTVNYRSIQFQQVEPFSDDMFECIDCGKTIKYSLGSVKTHYFKDHSFAYACKICDFRGQSRRDLKIHVARVHEKSLPYRERKLIPCPICGKPCPTGHVNQHAWTHKSQSEKQEAIDAGEKVPQALIKTHQCDECGRKFGTEKQLETHKETIHLTEEQKKEKMELCPECGGTFLHLKYHRLNVHGIGDNNGKFKLYTCLEDGCGKSFKGLQRLRQHKDAVHRKIRPHKCSLCPREFATPDSFQTHMNLHNGIRPFQCEHCPMAFGSKSNLTRHQGIYHTPGAPPPKRKTFLRGPCMLKADLRKSDLVKEGKYLPPSALATWAAGREPTSHFPVGSGPPTDSEN